MIRHQAWRYGMSILIMLALATTACTLSSSTRHRSSGTSALVLLLAPENRSQVAEGVPVQFHAIAQDTQVGVGYIEFSVDSIVQQRVDVPQSGGQSSFEATMSWVASGLQGHLIGAAAYRPDGLLLGESEVAIQVVAGPPASVVLVSPPSGSVLAEGSPVPLQAIAQDTTAGIGRVEFYLDGNLIGQVAADSTQPQTSLTATATWTAAGQGRHQIIAAAYRPDGTWIGEGLAVVEVGAGGSQVNNRPLVRITVDSLNIRQQPTDQAAVVGVARRDQTFPIVGRSAPPGDPGNWWAISYGGGAAWVASWYTTTEGDTSQVQLATGQ